MKLSTLGYATLVFAGLLAVPSPAAAQKETDTVNRTVPFPDKGIIKLDNFSGRVNITATAGGTVVVKAVRRAERDRLDHIKLDIRVEGSTIVIDANRRDAGSDVPLLMHSLQRSGNITASLPGGIGGKGVTFTTFSGHISIIK